jgi:hypothetical protein
MILGQIHFWATCDKSWKLQIFTNSRTITLTEHNNSISENLNTQLHIQINIPVKFYDPGSNTIWAMCYTNWKLKSFTKSRVITLTKQNKSTSDTPGAYRHKLINISVKFYKSRWNAFLVTCNKSRSETSSTELYILSNIPERFHCFRYLLFLITCNTSWKLQNFTKSRAITLLKQYESTSETSGGQLQMLINIPVRFHDSRSNTFWLTWDTIWEL